MATWDLRPFVRQGAQSDLPARLRVLNDDQHRERPNEPVQVAHNQHHHGCWVPCLQLGLQGTAR